MSTVRDARDLAAQVGRTGVWLSALSQVPSDQATRAAREIEELGWGALWIGEMPGYKEPLALAGGLLGATTRLTVATGIMSIWTHPASTAQWAASTLAEASGDRFVLGLGVSHREARPEAPPVKPLGALRQYLDELDATPYGGPAPAQALPRVLAALGPRMQELAAERSSGIHTFFTTPDDSAQARERVGAEVFLAPEQAVVVHDDPALAAEAARRHVGSRLGLQHYVNHLRRLGYGDDDLADRGSDRLVDAMVVHGTAESVLERVRQHLDAGADHVAVQPLPLPGGGGLPSVLEQLRRLAEVDGDLVGGAASPPVR
jgi:probable F420-dependent oxidoreductase